MEDYQSYETAQPLPALPNWTGNDAPGMMGYYYANDLSLMAPGSSEVPQVPVWNSQWMMHNQVQQIPQNYVQFLGESPYTGCFNKTPLDFPAETPSLGLLNPIQEHYLMPHGEGSMITNYSSMEHQLSIKNESWNEDYGSSSQTYAESDATTAKRVSCLQRIKQRDKIYSTDRNRRLRISKALEALQELLPHLKEVNKEAFLDNVIGHIQHLQNQVKDLSRTRFGSESTSGTSMFLEGPGHYTVNEPMHNKHVHDKVDELFKFDPAAATELLHSKGLLVLPVTLAEGLRDSVEMLDTKGMMELDRTIAEQLKLETNAMI